MTKTRRRARPVQTLTPNPRVLSAVRALTDDLHTVAWRTPEHGIVYNSRRHKREREAAR